MNRLWRWIASWWRSGYWQPPAAITYRAFVKGVPTTKAGAPVGIRGLHLLVQTSDGQEMVSAGAALDRDEFWRTWKHFGGQLKGWVDEDGNEVDLTA